jgi:hypothetical protein
MRDAARMAALLEIKGLGLYRSLRPPLDCSIFSPQIATACWQRRTMIFLPGEASPAYPHLYGSKTVGLCWQTRTTPLRTFSREDDVLSRRSPWPIQASRGPNAACDRCLDGDVPSCYLKGNQPIQVFLRFRPLPEVRNAPVILRRVDPRMHSKAPAFSYSIRKHEIPHPPNPNTRLDATVASRLPPMYTPVESTHIHNRRPLYGAPQIG